MKCQKISVANPLFSMSNTDSSFSLETLLFC